MTHAEIWDDSALVDSWNEALEEYKQYHSINARGEGAEDVLKRSADQNNGFDGKLDREGSQADDPQGKNLPDNSPGNATTSHGAEYRVEPVERIVTDQTSQPTTSKEPALPQHIIGQVHDEGLKNLLMAWYYAGYYTGLHEGKQQGAPGKSEPTSK